jgi:hypothetical protein
VLGVAAAVAMAAFALPALAQGADDAPGTARPDWAGSGEPGDHHAELLAELEGLEGDALVERLEGLFAEREAVRAERFAERETLRAERFAEREAQRAERFAAREAQRAERHAEVLAELDGLEGEELAAKLEELHAEHTAVRAERQAERQERQAERQELRTERQAFRAERRAAGAGHGVGLRMGADEG